jgi:hypothetical protein
MATATANYGLIKPDDEEFYDIDVFNDNADDIDTELFRVDTTMEKLILGKRRTTNDAATSGTTEKVCITLASVPLVANATHRVRMYVRVSGNTAADHAAIRIREDNLTGTIVAVVETPDVTGTGAGYTEIVEGFYITGGSPGSKTFVGTIVRQSGSGTFTVLTETNLSVIRVGNTTIFGTE